MEMRIALYQHALSALHLSSVKYADVCDSRYYV